MKKRGEGASKGIYSEKSSKQKRKFLMIDYTDSSQNRIVIVAVSSTHQLKLKSALSRIKSKAASYDNLVNSLSRKRYGRNTIVNRLFGIAVYMVQHAGMNGVSIISPMIIGAVLRNTGIMLETGLF